MPPSIRTIYEFQEPTFIENITQRPNGNLLLTTFRSGSVFEVDPSSPRPEARLISQLPPNNAQLTGIAQISPDVYVITSGVQPRPMRFVKGSIVAVKLDLSKGYENVGVETIAAFEDSECQNGMDSIPQNQNIVLSVDSVEGRVFRLDARTRKVDVVYQHESLRPLREGGKVPLGVNGAKIRDGYLYLSNSARSFFGRVKIDDVGNIKGDLEVPVSKNEQGLSMPYDDFAFDGAGNAFIGVHPNSVYKIEKETWKQSLFAGGVGNQAIQSPTSCTVSQDGTKLFVACAGKVGEFIGKVIEVSLV